jgi:aromatic-amino-acid transaminase
MTASPVLAARHRLTPSLCERLQPQAPDGLLALIGLHGQDPRSSKIDVGVGVFRNAAGATPVLACVKAAETQLLRLQDSKAYLGPEGDPLFIDLLQPLIFGEDAVGDSRLTGVQTPGGTGALRLAAELVARANGDAVVWMSEPTWPNHGPIFKASGLRSATYPFFDPHRQEVAFDAMLESLAAARAGDVVLVHGCCHNPTGAELTDGQWRALTELIVARGLLPLVDLAYQGLGRGLDEDAAGLRHLLSRVDEGLIAYSCDKNFGLYRERVGGLWLRAAGPDEALRARQNLLSLTRANWSMPPDHGAAIVRVILQSDLLTAGWRAELEAMRQRIVQLRLALAAADPLFAPLARQTGLFALLDLAPEAVAALRADHGIYMAGNGRINVYGLQPDSLDRFAAAVAPYLRNAR